MDISAENLIHLCIFEILHKYINHIVLSAFTENLIQTRPSALPPKPPISSTETKQTGGSFLLSDVRSMLRP